MPPQESEHPLDAGPVRLAEWLRDGVVSSVELTTEVLDRIEATQPTLNTFRRIRATEALQEAADADRRLKSGERAPLLGVPVAIKDDIDLAGVPTSFGCPGDFPPATVDSETVQRLKAGGAIIVGKTNAPELGQWPFTEGTAFGITRNPWHTDHTPGGSSGGSAAAVAGRIVPVAVGSDGAGSVRIPASWTNLVGIKPQSAPDVPFTEISISGPMARRTEDAALLLDVMTERDPDTHALAAARRDPGRLRIGLSFRAPLNGYRVRLDPEIKQAVFRLATVLTGLGHEVVPVDPHYGLIGLNFLPRSTAGLADWMARVPDPSLLDPRTRQNVANGDRMGKLTLLVWFAKLTAHRYEHQVGRVFQDVDVLLMPTTATPPPRIGAWAAMRPQALNRTMVAGCPYAWAWNVLGWPGVNVPAGFTAAGLPVGAQLLGTNGDERRLISLAAQLESAEKWADPVPPSYPRFA